MDRNELYRRAFADLSEFLDDMFGTKWTAQYLKDLGYTYEERSELKYDFYSDEDLENDEEEF